mmetsp:Transcript_71730/g.99335  ORF Transcript_71730/g.99335 Transcript_71730/m.99335 type:complete len:140 (+) Transcript_71730:420-839(+)
MNKKAREEAKQAIYSNQQMTRDRNANEAERLKQERAQHEEMISVQKRQEEMKAMSMKQMIRNQKQEQVEQRAMEQQQKRLAQRRELINKINLENERRFQIEAEVARMEAEEAEWIKKLQNTSQIQAVAYNELENALNGE